jgi:hypothetical protein
MKYIEKYDRYIDDDMVVYRYCKNKDKLIQCKFSDNGKGYIWVSVKNEHSNSVCLHRLVYEAFIGDIPNGYQIDHINTNKKDNRLTNLRCVTPKENMRNILTRERLQSDFR